MDKEFFNCGLKGKTLSYLEIYRSEGLSEKGKDKFINALLDVTQQKSDSIFKKQLDDNVEIIRALRDELYEKLPSGDIDPFKLIKIIKAHIEEIDEVFSEKTSGADEKT